MDINDLNGIYDVTINSNLGDYYPGYYDIGTARCIISRGTIAGSDPGGCTWTGTMQLHSSNPHLERVQFIPGHNLY